MSTVRAMKQTAAAALACSLGLVVFRALVRPWYRWWGSTPEERARPMPLDERLPGEPMSTRAITIDASPERVWPWLVQMGGVPRGGYYSYTWIERLQGMDVRNVHRVLPEYQSLQVGEALDRRGATRVLAVEPCLHLVLGPGDGIDYLQYTWAFELRALGSTRTRLVTRVRMRMRWRDVLCAVPWYTWPTWLLFDTGAFLMERKMLIEIKRHAEALATSGDGFAIS